MHGFLLLACLALLQQRPTADAAAGDNVAEFRLLCTIYKACSEATGLTDESADTAVDQHLRTLIALNMTSAADEFYDRDFSDEKTKSETDSNYTAFRKQWEEIKKNIQAGKEVAMEVKLQRLPPSKLRDELNSAISGSIKALTETKETLPQAKTAGQIKATLKEVIYGTGQSTASSTGGQTFGASLNDACGNDGSSANAAGLSLANDMVCLCAGSGSAAAAGCLSTTGSLTSYFSTTSNAGSALEHLAAKCPATAISNDLPAVLTTLATAFTNRIGQHAGTNQNRVTHYGKGAQDTCSGANEEGCINYKKQMEGKNIAIPWLSKLHQAVDEIKQQQKRSAAIEALKKEAAAAATQGIKAYKNTQVLEALLKAATNQNQGPEAVAGKAQQEKIEEECNKQDKDTDCTANPKCAWNEKAADPKKKCTLSEEGKQKAAEKANQETEGKDEKPGTTNTTASNSFVINKAPLLLAFLLF
uniref:Variant surface glycoprotein n=1 Tax=Trypanosoma brucei TaxID=5691 RepID=S5FWT9_9TRYP|nr:variant surface glycoprotein [Trypanosoma brucei]